MQTRARSRAQTSSSVPVCRGFRGQHGRPLVIGVADKTKALYLLQMLLRFVLWQDFRIYTVLNYA